MSYGAGFDGKHVELRHAHADIPPTSVYGRVSSPDLADGPRAGRAADVQPDVAQRLQRAAFGRRT